MKKLSLLFLTVIIMTSCKKEKDEIPFIPQTYEFLKNEFVGNTKSYNSDGLINDNVEFDQDFLNMYSQSSYFMDEIEFISDTLATFHFNDREDSISTVRYNESDADITFNRITETDAIPSSVLFLKSENNLKATCTGIRFILNQSLHTYLFFGDMTSEYLQTVQNSLNEGEKIYIQQFSVVYKPK
jgi:hypothetical protein